MMMQPFVRPPSAGYAGEQDPDLLRNPRGWLSMVGRLQDDASPEQARAELTTLLAGAALDTQPAAPPGAAIDVVRIDDEITPDRLRMTLDRLAARRDRGRRAADCLREHREFAVDESSGAAARIRGAARDGCVARAHRPSVARRERDALSRSAARSA